MSLNHNRDDIYTETNEHGYPQTYQISGSGPDDAVCTSCGVLVRPNTGQGMECTTCQTEDMLECQIDYDEGQLPD